MLTKLHLENFKGWENLELDLSNINILFGTNSSGKTSILHALLLLKQNTFEPSQPINLGGREQDYVDFGSFRDLVFGHDESKQVGVKIETKAYLNLDNRYPIHDVGYKVHWRQIGDQVKVQEITYTGSLETKESVWLRLELEEDLYKVTSNFELFIPADMQVLSESGEPLIPLVNSYALPIRLSTGAEATIPLWLFNLAYDFITQFIHYLGPLRDKPERTYFWKGTAPQEIGTRGEGTIDILLASERAQTNGHRKLDKPAPALFNQVSGWLAKMGLVSSFRLEPIDLDKRYYITRVKVAEMDFESSLVDVGFGISQVLPVITLLFHAPEGSTILIEQPELHLHPRAQAHLADLFLEAAEQRSLQLIIESHSEHLLRRLQRRIAEQKYDYASPETIKMYFCDSEDSGLTIRPVEVDRFGQIANWPHHFFGDITGDLHAMTDAALDRSRQELLRNG